MRIFFGSSQEKKPLMEEIAGWLEGEGAEILLWSDPHAFVAGQYALQRLIELARTEVDAAILIFGADDKVWYRGAERAQPRDNVLLEFGLFASQLGEDHTIICTESNTAMPSDLAGLHFIKVTQRLEAKKKVLAWYKNANKSGPLRSRVETNTSSQPDSTDRPSAFEKIRLYLPPRELSDRDMLKDLSTAKHATFIGVSHQRLAGYLSEVLKSSKQPIPLRHIIVCYASPQDGQLFEQAMFRSNLASSRRQIAATLMDPSFRSCLTNLQSLTFLQSQHHRMFGGCAFINSTNESKIYYINHYLPRQDPEAEDLLTFRCTEDATETVGGDLWAVYGSAFGFVIQQGRKIGTFRLSLWDLSIHQWRNFVRHCTAHQQSMKTLVDLLALKPSERVLDIGAATGDMSRPAMEKNVKLTLLDDSPTMIRACRELFGNTAEYALCSAGDFENEDPIELAHPYDAIICHLALPSLAGDETELNRLAQWCAAHLHCSGRLGIACHNTTVKTPDSNFDSTDEPLRRAFKAIAGRRGISASYRATVAPMFTPEQIEAAFNKAGFKVDRRHQEHYLMLMNDRLLMWSAPAVLDRLFRMEQLSNDDVKVLIDETRHELGAQQTPDMVVSFWIFQATNSSDFSD